MSLSIVAEVVMTSSFERMSLDPGTSCQLTATSCQPLCSQNENRGVPVRQSGAGFGISSIIAPQKPTKTKTSYIVSGKA